MKKKHPVHPRLYTDVSINSSSIIYKYYSNHIDDNNQRIIKKDIQKRDRGNNYNMPFLDKMNKAEYQKLLKYIEIQKKALEKHEKSGNYDSCRIVESSILLMEEFKLAFKDWFIDNNFQI